MVRVTHWVTSIDKELLLDQLQWVYKSSTAAGGCNHLLLAGLMHVVGNVLAVNGLTRRMRQTPSPRQKLFLCGACVELN